MGAVPTSHLVILCFARGVGARDLGAVDRPRLLKVRTWTVRGRLGFLDGARVSGQLLVSTAPPLHRPAPRRCMGRSTPFSA